LEYSQSFRTLWMLEELGIDYELVLYERDKKTLLAPAAYKKLSPLGTAPVITQGDLALAETSAITDYILDGFGATPLRPMAGDTHHARHLFWYHAAQGSLMPLMLVDSVLKIVQKRAPLVLRPMVKLVGKILIDNFIKPRVGVFLAKAEADLDKAVWFGGDQLTVADITLSYPMKSAFERGYIGPEHKHCRAWLQRIGERPAFKSAQEKDGRPSMVLPL
jgi:glutathione S-transferase